MTSGMLLLATKVVARKGLPLYRLKNSKSPGCTALKRSHKTMNITTPDPNISHKDFTDDVFVFEAMHVRTLKKNVASGHICDKKQV